MATEKTCFKCCATKPLADFYRHSMMGDGHLNKCKECTKADAKASRAANIDKYREYDRQRASLPHRKELQKRVTAIFRAKTPERRAAHLQVQYALRSGKLTRQPCEVCGATPADAHHPDYSQPLAIVWLCPPHHSQAHAMVA